MAYCIWKLCGLWYEHAMALQHVAEGKRASLHGNHVGQLVLLQKQHELQVVQIS